METIKDILDEIRDIADAGNGHLSIHAPTFANRIEQAVTNCNQFKMREALERIIKQVYEVDECTNADVPYLRAFTNHIQQTAILALSAPPRNCDLYPKDEVRLAYHLHGDGLMTMQAFADWLFAEAKGEVK